MLKVLLTTLFLLVAQPCFALDVKLVWNPNIESDLAGYRIFVRYEGTSYDYNFPNWDGVETTCDITDLPNCEVIYFVARAYDQSGNESMDSNEVKYEIATLSIADFDRDCDVDGADLQRFSTEFGK